MKIPLDIIGDIAILKFPKEYTKKQKINYAKEFLEEHKNIKTILEKTSKIKGRLRIAETKFLAGENKKQTTYVENGCRFKLDVDKTYFSSRLGNHRLEVANEISNKIKKNQNIIVMFAGVAPLPITLAKILKQNNKLDNIKIISEEINKEASKYAIENVKLNKFQDNIQVVQCDAKKLPEKLKKLNLHIAERKADNIKGRLNVKGTLVPLRYDFIFMARPNLKETFLNPAIKISKKSTIIYYHGFGTKEEVIKEVTPFQKKLKIISMKPAGEIGPHRYRWLVKFKVR